MGGSTNATRIAGQARRTAGRGSVRPRTAVGTVGRFGRLGLAVTVIGSVTAASMTAVPQVARALTFEVTTTADTGPGSLRQAILDANALAGADLITFAIPGAGVQTISPLSPLPQITDTVTVDGYTQPGASANTLAVGSDAVLLIELSGQGNTAAATHQTGLDIVADDVVVRGLVINGHNRPDFVFTGADIRIRSGASRAVIEGNFLGTNAAGTAKTVPTSLSGVDVFGDAAVVGGDQPGQRNVALGVFAGVNVRNDGSATVLGNYLGTDASGTIGISGDGSGVLLEARAGAVVGSITPGGGNLLSGNDFGIQVAGAAAGFTKAIYGNLIGTDATGIAKSADLAGVNQSFGVFVGNFVSGGTVQIGTGAASGGNVITGGRGIFSGGPSIDVRGNHIGVDATGTSALPILDAGIYLQDGFDSRIGGAGPRDGNMIANAQYGVFVYAGNSAVGQRHTIVGNAMGANAIAGIALRNGGPNDPGDPDVGANNLQNHPVIAPSVVGGDLIVDYTIDSIAPNSTYPIAIDVYLADDALGRSGQVYLGRTTAVGPGAGTVNLGSETGAVVGQTIVATATDANGNTSPFSTPAVAGPGTAIVVDSIGDAPEVSPGDGTCETATPGECTLRAAITTANEAGTPSTYVAFAIQGAGVHTLTPSTPYPDLLAPIDGLTQPGSDCSTWPPTLSVEIDASSLGAPGNVFTVPQPAYGVRIRGLAIGGMDMPRAAIAVADGSAETRIECTFLGTDATGTPNTPSTEPPLVFDSGVLGSSLEVGGPQDIERNLIVGGVRATCAAVPGGRFELDNNYINTTVDGTGPAAGPTLGDGVSSSCNGLISNNRIAFGAGFSGVAVSATRAKIRTNDIIGPGTSGITGTVDPSPVVTSAEVAIGFTRVAGSLAGGVPNATWFIDVFNSRTCAAIGERWIGSSFEVTALADGTATFDLTSPGGFGNGWQNVTVTATNADPANGTTSAFSTCFLATVLDTSIALDFDVAAGAPTTVDVAPGGIRVTDLDRGALGGAGSAGSIASSSIDTIGPEDTALASITIGSTPLRAVVLESAPLRAVPLVDIEVNAAGGGGAGGWTELLAGTELENVPLANLTFGDALANTTVSGRIAALPLRAVEVGGTPLRAVPLAAIVLGATPLRGVPLRAVAPGEPNAWCAVIEPLLVAPQTCEQALDEFNLMEVALRGAPLRGVDLSSIPLRGVAIAESPLRGVPLRGVDIDASPLRGVPLRAVDLDASPLRAVPLRGVPLRGVPLRAVDLDTTPLRAVTLDSVPLRAVLVEGLSVDGVPLRGVPLRGVPLRGVDLETSPLRAVPLRDVPLRGVPLNAIELAASPLRAVPLRGVDIVGSPLAAIPLRAVDLQTSPLRAVPLRGVPLRGVPLRGVPVGALTIGGTPLRAVPLRGVDILSSPLRGVPLRGVTVPGAIDCSRVDCVRGTLGDAVPARAVSPAATLGDVIDATAGIRLSDVAPYFADFTAADLGAALANSALTFGDLETLDDMVLGDLPLDHADFGTLVLGDLGAALSRATLADLIGRVDGPDDQPYTESQLQAILDGWTVTIGDLVAADPGNLTMGDVFDASGPDVHLADLGSLLDHLNVAQLVAIVPGLAEQVGLMTETLGDLTPEQLGRMTLGDLGDAAGDVTIGELLASLGGLLDDYTLGDLLLALVDPGSLAHGGVEFDRFDERSLPLGTIGATTFEASFTLTAAVDQNVKVEVALPSQATYVAGSALVDGTALEPAVVGRTLVWSLIADNSAAAIDIAFDVLPALRLGSTSLTATASIPGTDVTSTATTSVVVAEGAEPNDFAESAGAGSPRETTAAAEDVVYLTYIPTPTDIDVFEIDLAENDRLVVQLSNLDADLDLVLWSRPADAAAAAALGPVSAEAPLRPLVDPDADGADATPLDDFVRLDTLDPGVRFVAASNQSGTADEVISTDRLPAGTYYVQVIGANGATNVAPASLQLKVREADATPVCRAIDPLPTATAVPPAPVIPGSANTLILVNPSRIEQIHGAADRAAVVAATGRITAYLAANPQLGVTPVVVPVDAYPDVRAAYAAWDGPAGSCDPDAANAVVAAINREIIDPHRVQFEHIVFLGGDELIPMARLHDGALVANEYDFRNEFDGDLVGGAGNARNAATASLWESTILSDEPYGDAAARSTGHGYLYVSDAALGRVVETPDEIVDALDTFVAFGGTLAIETATVLGYDFLTDGSVAVADEIAAAGLPVDRDLQSGLNSGGAAWDAADATAELGQAGTRALVSLNAHFDHYRALPAVGDQVPGFDDNLVATEVASTLGPAALAQSLVFSMGCHSGFSVSDVLVGTTNTDWAQTLAQQDALFVGNTGFGYGDTEAVAYTEELMRLFAEHVTSPFALPLGPTTSSSTVGQALTWAKNDFVAGLQSFSVYDEKAVMESTFFGLPFYRVGLVPEALPPAPTRTAGPDGSGISVSRVEVAATNATVVTPSGSYPANTDASGDELVIVAPGRPIQPKLVEDISVVEPGDTTTLALVAHGAIVEDMTSVYGQVADPVIATPVFDASASRPEPDAGDVAFPTKPLEITSSTGPAGERQQLVLATGQYRSDSGVQRLDSDLDVVVYYADPDETDFTAPTIGAVEAQLVGGRLAISTTVDDASSDVDRVYVIVVENPGVGPAEWTGVDLVRSGSTDRWTGSLVLAPSTTDVEFIVQAADGAGNVGVATNKARNFDVDQEPAPPAPPAAVLTAGPSAAPAPSGIYASDVEIVVTANVAAIYSIDGVVLGAVPASGRFPITGDGLHTWEVAVPSGHVVGGTVLIDTAPPVPAIDRAAGAVSAGTTVTLTAGDAGAGVASVTFSATGAITIAPTTVTGASAALLLTTPGETTVTVVATDTVGNVSAPLTFTYVVDGAAPVVTGAVSTQPNAGGWHRQPFQVVWTSDDPQATTPPPTSVTTEAAGRVITSAPSCDTAGNCGTGSVTVSLDLSAPDGSITTDEPANAEDWNNTPVTVRVTCGPDLSGVVCPEPVVVATDGAAQTVAISLIDAADNVTSLVSRVINIDRVAPVVTWTAPADGAVVAQSAYTRPTCQVSDALSGTGGVCTVDIPDPDMTTPGRSTYTATAVGSDKAGNTTTLTSTYTVLTDEQGPLVDVTAAPQANPAGWWNTPVTYTFACADPTGVASCPASRTVSAQGANQSFTVTATDRNGNGTPVTVSAINIDLTAPTLTVTAPTSVGPLDTVTITCAAADALSGIAASACVDRTFAASTLVPGANTFTFTATDAAGNVATATRTITLVVPTNAAPTVRADLGVVGLEEIGFQTNIVVIDGTFADPGGPGPFTASVRWSSGGAFTPLVLTSGNQFVAANIYGSAGTRTVTIRICDAGGACGSDDIVVRTRVTQRITPIRECVVDRGAGTSPRFQARWGYDNPAPFAIAVPSIPILENTFTSTPFLRGQPQILLPGARRNVFTTTFSSGSSAWRINGTTATATSGSIRC